VETLREREQQLLQQSRLAAMGEMINNIAHQWRQPLNVLGLWVQQMPIVFDMGSFSKEYLSSIVTNSMEQINYMSRTIDEFRNFFKPDKEKIDFTIRETVAKAVALVENSFKIQKIGIDVHADSNPSIYGYQNEYSQVLLNIIMNAKDELLTNSSDNATITITISREHGNGVVTIADNGGGIPQGIMSKIFEPYFTTKGPDRGTGVGLFMSKAIIEKNMGGRLTARNIAKGAEFRIEVCESAKRIPSHGTDSEYTGN
jgi:signal transduction histidine kinase